MRNALSLLPGQLSNVLALEQKEIEALSLFPKLLKPLHQINSLNTYLLDAYSIKVTDLGYRK